MARPQVYIGRMFSEKDGEGRANSPLISSVTCTAATQNMPIIAVALANADQLRNGSLAQASLTNMGAEHEISALQRATGVTSDRGRSS